ncbi:MAG: hypothetical protein JWO02_2768 [Solirubrobacterales bacterium]|nr:hypothetical protein [Solirubrobacterales bacterium]
MNIRGICCAIIGVAAIALPAAAQAATTNVPLLGLGSATAVGQTASATPATVPGVAAVSTSTAGANGAHWDAASVAGTSLYGKTSSGAYTGLLAGLGSTIDTVNAALCPAGQAGASCVIVLAANGAGCKAGTSGSCVQGALLGLSANGGAQAIEVGGSAASSFHNSDCSSSGAAAWLVSVAANGDRYTVDGTPDVTSGCGGTATAKR